jgi:hypothetical protein
MAEIERLINGGHPDERVKHGEHSDEPWYFGVPELETV